MVVKILNKLLLVMVIGLTSLSGFADSASSGSNSSPANGEAVLLLQCQYPKTKRMPSRNFLEVVYADGLLSLQSNCYEGGYALSFENCESGECCQVPSIQVGETIPLTLPLGEYQVIAEGEDGSVLSGYMEVF